MPASVADSQASEGYEMRFVEFLALWLGATHNARNFTAHGVRLTQQILLHYGCNRNAEETVGPVDQ